MHIFFNIVAFAVRLKTLTISGVQYLYFSTCFFLLFFWCCFECDADFRIETELVVVIIMYLLIECNSYLKFYMEIKTSKNFIMQIHFSLIWHSYKKNLHIRYFYCLFSNILFKKEFHLVMSAYAGIRY